MRRGTFSRSRGCNNRGGKPLPFSARKVLYRFYPSGTRPNPPVIGKNRYHREFVVRFPPVLTLSQRNLFMCVCRATMSSMLSVVRQQSHRVRFRMQLAVLNGSMLFFRPIFSTVYAVTISYFYLLLSAFIKTHP